MHVSTFNQKKKNQFCFAILFIVFSPTENLDIYVKSDVKLEKNDDYHIFNITDVHVKYSIGGLKFRLNNLFDGIKALEETTNTYLNENWRTVAESLNPILVKTIQNLMLSILKRIFDNVPADFFIGDISS